MQTLAGIITEGKESLQYEFQIRDIGGPIFYKRKKGDSLWDFISAEEFAENSHKGKIIEWDKKNK
jgi:hypothetical protein